MTPAEFLKRVANRLGVLPIGQALGAEDAELIQTAYTGLLAELAEHKLAWWSSDEDVPDEMVEPLSGMVAASVVDDFSIAEPRRSMLISQHGYGLPVASVAERRLRALAASPSSYPVEIEYL
jgi:hypothetical protein